MKRKIVLMAVSVFLNSVLICEAQQQEKQAPVKTEKISKLDMFNGIWRGVYKVETEITGENDDFNVNVDRNTYGRTEVDVMRSNENTVILNCKKSPFIFTLKYIPEKKYFFTMKNNSGPSIEKIPLSFSDESGYIGQDTVKTAANVLIRKVTIKGNEEGGYKWIITFNDSKKGKVICSIEMIEKIK